MRAEDNYDKSAVQRNDYYLQTYKMDHYYSSYEDFIGPITLHTLHFDYIRSYASIM